jgi:hypothetical protein
MGGEPQRLQCAGGSPRAIFCPSPARGNASHRPQTT